MERVQNLEHFCGRNGAGGEMNTCTLTEDLDMDTVHTGPKFPLKRLVWGPLQRFILLYSTRLSLDEASWTRSHLDYTILARYAR